MPGLPLAAPRQRRRLSLKAEALFDEKFQFLALLDIVAFTAPEDVAGVVKQDKGRPGADGKLCANGAGSPVFAEQEAIADALFLPHRFNLADLVGERAVFVGDADDFQAIGAVAIVQGVEVRDGLEAVAAPTAAEIEEDELAAMMAKFPGLSAGFAKGQIIECVSSQDARGHARRT
jgi:hypothetical protein